MLCEQCPLYHISDTASQLLLDHLHHRSHVLMRLLRTLVLSETMLCICVLLSRGTTMATQ
jgi:hypothetical protein